jgi:hypothetical protein
LALLPFGVWSSDSDDARRWWAHIVYLADDKLAGRETGSEGHRLAARYVSQEFERATLAPVGTSGYLQPIPLRTQRLEEAESSLEILSGGVWRKLELGEDAYFSARDNAGGDWEAPVVFAGYGFAVPQRQFDEFAGLDVRGKIVLYLTGGPRNLPGPLMATAQRERWRRLREAGAVGLASIPNPKSADIPWERARLSRFMPSMQLAQMPSEGPPFSLTVNPARADLFLAGGSHSLEEILGLVQSGQPLPKFDTGVSIRARVRLSTGKVESENVAGLKAGSHPVLKNQYVILTAHLDHVGVGRPIRDDRIYNGAMDNASGIATLIEVARMLKDTPVNRSVLFVAVTGEEKGLLGSKYFAQFPTVPRQAIVANLNFDMFLPLYPFKLLTVIGLEESTLGDVAREVAAAREIPVQSDPEPQRNSFVRSDQYSFVRQGIPAIAFKVGYRSGSNEEATFKTWLRERYHAPSDDIHQPVDKNAAVEFNRLIAAVAEAVANRESAPAWKKTERTASPE